MGGKRCKGGGRAKKTHPMETKTKDGLVLQEGLGFCLQGRASSGGKQRIGWRGTQGADHKREGERETKRRRRGRSGKEGKKKMNRNGEAEQKGKGRQRGSKARGMGQIQRRGR